MSDSKRNLLLFFERPLEPCFMGKGEEKKIFKVPERYLPDKYKNVTNISNRFGDDENRDIRVNDDVALPDFSEPMKLAYNDHFSLFVPAHRIMAGRLIGIFMDMRDVDDLIAACTYCQLHINPYMFNYCLSVAMLHRDDCKGLPIPNFMESFPDKFTDPKVIHQCRSVTYASPNIPTDRPPVTIPRNFTASDHEPEQRLAYFREDIGINLHHWHWHLVYPFEVAQDSGNSIVNKDRRGELFYYMHQQIIARYTVERFCNGLGRPERFSNFRQPITDGYFPKLTSQVAGNYYPPRFPNMTIRDIVRPQDRIKADVSQLETWRDRFLDAINNGTVRLPNNKTIPLTEETGIDMLGNMMESSSISVNRGYYGNLHNMGHNFIAYAHDPDYRHMEKPGVMGDSATAMRDPIFYRWHSYLDDLFVTYKNKLTPYSAPQLTLPGIQVSNISLEGRAGSNTLATQWEQSTIDLGIGIAFTRGSGSVPARYTHLQHDEFDYVINVQNSTGQSVHGMFRIFIAPTVDDQNKSLSFDEQRRLMIELDKFHRELRPGANRITQRSVDSSVTIPYERTFRDQSRRGTQGSAEAADFDFCGCGWPHHMLIPKGTQSGYPMVLFVMVSNWQEDRVEQDLVGSCNDAASYCGIRDRRYPDRKAMGYPFDRRGRSGVNNLTDFLTPNMAVRQCNIRFTDVTRQRSNTTQ